MKTTKTIRLLIALFFVAVMTGCAVVGGLAGGALGRARGLQGGSQLATVFHEIVIGLVGCVPGGLVPHVGGLDIATGVEHGLLCGRHGGFS